MGAATSTTVASARLIGKDRIKQSIARAPLRML
jgi:hypothetical protein